MMPTQPKLEEIAFFEGMDPCYLEILAENAVHVDFEPGDYLLRQCEACEYFYIILSGKVAVVSYCGGRDPVTIEYLSRNKVLGWSWLIPPYCWRYGARAAQQTSTVALDAEFIRALCQEDHEFGYQMLTRFIHVLAERLEFTRMAHLPG